MLDENLLITASKAARGIAAAQAAVDEAKRLVEEAKAGVEAAKNGLAEARAKYDAVISEIAGTGISASKARKAVDDMLRIFAEVGIIDAPSDEAPAEPKAPRRKKSEPAPAPVEVVAAAKALAAQGEPGVIQIAAGAAVEMAAEVEEPATQEEAHAAEQASSVAEAAMQPEAEVAQEIDNGEAIGEIYEFIETATEGEDISVSETLITLLNAADWYSREHRQEPLSLDLYRDILNVDFVNQAAASDGLDREMKVSLDAVRQSAASKSIFDWFLYVLDKLEDGVKYLSYVDHLAAKTPAAVSKQPSVSAPSAAVEQDPVEPTSVEAVEEEEVFRPATDDYTQDPESDEDPADEVSDDVTLAADDGLVGVVVEDIEEINFLDQAVVPVASEAQAEAPASTAAAADADGSAPRGFKRPSFLSKKN